MDSSAPATCTTRDRSRPAHGPTPARHPPTIRRAGPKGTTDAPGRLPGGSSRRAPAQRAERQVLGPPVDAGRGDL